MKKFLLGMMALALAIMAFGACNKDAESSSSSVLPPAGSESTESGSSGDSSIVTPPPTSSDSDSGEANYFTVTFKQEGKADIVFEGVKENSIFTEIPKPADKTGYNVVWKQEDLAKLNGVAGNVIVQAIETAKSYTITLDAKGGTVDKTTITVVYGQAYELPLPKRSGYTFISWRNGQRSFPRKGMWTYDISDTALYAQWEKGVWTPNY